ncbi:Peptide chain release factor 1 [Eubacterium plexicaudatum ASF492]|nr:Peptide chain release factor 1 [Eubacterium plexicaudatum ASF492]
MFDRLEDLLLRYEEVMNQLSEPDVANDTNRFRSLMKEQSNLSPIVETYEAYKKKNKILKTVCPCWRKNPTMNCVSWRKKS